MKKKFGCIVTILLLLISSCVMHNCVAQLSEPMLPIQLQQIDLVQKIDLEYVNFSRIEKAVKKYEKLYSKARWMKRLKYAAIGVGCAGLGMLILNQWFNTQGKAQDKSCDASKVDKPSEAQVNRKADLDLKIDEQWLEDHTTAGKFKNGALSAVSIIACSVVMIPFWKIVNNGSEIFNEYFAGIDLQDPDFYKQKNEKVNDLIQRLGLFLMDGNQKLQNKDAGTIFFDLVLADVLIDHTTLVRWFEDIVGFIKCTVILNNGKDSLELACLEKDIEVLSGKLNKFTDEVSAIINSPGDNLPDIQDRSKLVDLTVASYLNFCKQFSKFIYDCGLYLYEDDFLRK